MKQVYLVFLLFLITSTYAQEEDFESNIKIQSTPSLKGYIKEIQFF
jgi:hypothetical protein